MKNIRYYVFWIVDFLKGSPIRNHYKEIQSIFNATDGAEELEKKLLSHILHYAVEHTAFYKGFNPKEITDFPVISKTDIIQNMDAMFSSEYKPIKEKLKTMSTSGSSGTPFKIYQDPGKVLRNKADLVFFYQIGGYDVGDRMYYMRIWTEINRKPKAKLFKENFRMLDTSNLDAVGASNFKNIMSSYKREKVLLAYASSFTALMNHLEKEEKRDWGVKSIFTQAEELPLKIKRKMELTFGCPVMSRYSNQENGMLGQQPSTGESYFRLNKGSYFIEFLKLDADVPAKEMEEARIVVTDLFNKAVPMIRYDTGDVGVYQYIEDASGKKHKVLALIKGRKNDYLYSNKKEKLAPQSFSVLMWKYNCIKQYQLIQYNYEEIALKIVYKEDFNGDETKIESQLIHDIQQLFGPSTKIHIQKLKNIPIAESGKRKYIISKIDD